jgi:hypothetical protein
MEFQDRGEWLDDLHINLVTSHVSMIRIASMKGSFNNKVVGTVAAIMTSWEEGSVRLQTRHCDRAQRTWTFLALPD